MKKLLLWLGASGLGLLFCTSPSQAFPFGWWFTDHYKWEGDYLALVPAYSTEEEKYLDKDAELNGIKVGDTVIPDDFRKGVGLVVGINYKEKVYAVVGNYDRKLYRYGFSRLSKMEGELHGIKVSDRVIPRGYSYGFGVVVAINSEKETYVVEGNNSHRYGTYSLDFLALTQGDLEGFQIGDKIDLSEVNAEVNSELGILVGVNSRDQTLTVEAVKDKKLHRMNLLKDRIRSISE